MIRGLQQNLQKMGNIRRALKTLMRKLDINITGEHRTGRLDKILKDMILEEEETSATDRGRPGWRGRVPENVEPICRLHG
jgi:hypothetical protein